MTDLFPSRRRLNYAACIRVLLVMLRSTFMADGRGFFFFIPRRCCSAGLVSLLFVQTCFGEPAGPPRLDHSFDFVHPAVSVHRHRMHASVCFGFIVPRRVGEKQRITALGDYFARRTFRKTSTAIVFPIYNENAMRVYEGLRATYESLEKTELIGRFDFPDPERFHRSRQMGRGGKSAGTTSSANSARWGASTIAAASLTKAGKAATSGIFSIRGDGGTAILLCLTLTA